MRFLKSLREPHSLDQACFRRFLRRLEVLLRLLASGLSESAFSFLLELVSFWGVNFSTSFRTLDVDGCFLGAGIKGWSAALQPTDVIGVLQLLKDFIHCAMNRVSTRTVWEVEGLQPSITPVETWINRPGKGPIFFVVAQKNFASGIV